MQRSSRIKEDGLLVNSAQAPSKEWWEERRTLVKKWLALRAEETANKAEDPNSMMRAPRLWYLGEDQSVMTKGDVERRAHTLKQEVGKTGVPQSLPRAGLQEPKAPHYVSPRFYVIFQRVSHMNAVFPSSPLLPFHHQLPPRLLFPVTFTVSYSLVTTVKYIHIHIHMYTSHVSWCSHCSDLILATPPLRFHGAVFLSYTGDTISQQTPRSSRLYSLSVLSSVRLCGPLLGDVCCSSQSALRIFTGCDFYSSLHPL